MLAKCFRLFLTSCGKKGMLQHWQLAVHEMVFIQCSMNTSQVDGDLVGQNISVIVIMMARISQP